jgi:hypothetical protein
MPPAILNFEELSAMANASPQHHARFEVEKTDRYFAPIIKAVRRVQAINGGHGASFKDIYKFVCLDLGATQEQAILGKAPCPYKGGLKDQKGLIRSWIEEHSPHSRQFYFRAGRRTNWRGDKKRLLFTNSLLGEMNNAVGWQPYRAVRGNGWCFDPLAAQNWVQPSEDVLMIAEALYKKKGMQGISRTPLKQDVIYSAVNIS